MKYTIESWSTSTPGDAVTKVSLKGSTEVAEGIFSTSFIDLVVEGFFPDYSEDFLEAVANKLLASKLITSKDELSFM